MPSSLLTYIQYNTKSSFVNHFWCCIFATLWRNDGFETLAEYAQRTLGKLWVGMQLALLGAAVGYIGKARILAGQIPILEQICKLTCCDALRKCYGQQIYVGDKIAC